MAGPAKISKRRGGRLAAFLLVISLALIVLTTGLMASRSTGDWAWFPRSGSMLVTLGILFAYFNFDYRLEKGLYRTGRIAARVIRQFAPESGFLARLTDINNRMEERLDDIPNKVKTIEVVIIGVGTIVWGFGDLLG